MASTGELVQGDISALAARYGNEIITAQINEDVPIIGSGALEKIKAKGKTIIVNIIGGGLDSTAFLADGGDLQEGSSAIPLQGTEVPRHVLARLSIGRGAAMVNDGIEDSVNQVKFQLENAGRDAARKLGRSLFSAELNVDGYVGGVAPTGNATYTNVGFDDISGFREGDAVVLYDTSADDTFLLTVSQVTPAPVNGNSANVAGTVTLASSGSANGTLPTIASNDTFWLRGVYNITGSGGTAVLQNVVPNSFNDVAGSGTLHGISGSAVGYGWQGITASSFGVITQENLSAVAMRIRALSGKQFSHVVLNPAASAAFAASAATPGTAFGSGSGLSGAGRRKNVGMDSDGLGNVLDKYESGLRFMAKPVLIEPNCPATEIVFHNKDMVKLAMWREFEPFSDGDGAVMVSRSTFSYDIQLSASANMVCNQRRAIAVCTGVSGL